MSTPTQAQVDAARKVLDQEALAKKTGNSNLTRAEKMVANFRENGQKGFFGRNVGVSR